MFIPYSMINALTTVQITRKLSRPGEVLVHNGEPVEPMRVVARSMKPANFTIVDVARTLDVPVKQVPNYYKVKRGETVERGGVIAAKGGRVCRAPIAGKIASRGSRRVLIEAATQTENLSALVPGIVIDVWEGSGVMIEAVGSMIQASWGNGQESFGTLRFAVSDSEVDLQQEHISMASQGSILVGAKTLDEETLAEAIAMQVQGIVVGSLSPKLIKKVEAVEIPVLVTEGFGSAPMNAVAFELLRSLDGRQISLSGDMGNRWQKQRPFMLIPMPSQSGRIINPDTELVIGDQVRILRGEALGKTGSVAGLASTPLLLDTGARVPGVTVDIGDGNLVQVPMINVERIL